MADRYGPEYLVEVFDPALEMRGFLVIDNTANGLGKGGIRMTPTVTAAEVARLARTMTWKNALAGIPFGGAKAGIIWNGGSAELKKKFLQSFARRIALFTPRKYIAGPDVNTGEREMQWFVEATGNWRSATGKPADLCMQVFGRKGEKCGLPHEFGSTGFGVACAARVAAEQAGLSMKGATVAIEGFGNVGTFACRHLEAMGANITAVADSRGTVFATNGLSCATLEKVKQHKGSVVFYPQAEKLPREAIFSIPADILIPASVTDVIHEKNMHAIKAKIVVEGANIPMSESVEEKLHQKGIVIVPDVVANAGGVISSYAEYRGYNPKRMFALVERKITALTKNVLTEARRRQENPRRVAMDLAVAIIEKKMKERLKKSQ